MLSLVLAASLLSAPHPVATDTLRAAPGPQHHVTLASGSNGFFAAWEHKSTSAAGSGDVVGTRITPDGHVVDASGGIPLQPSWVADTSPALVWNGVNYVLLFTRGPQPWPYGLEAVEISPAGEIVRVKELVSPRDVQFVDVAFNGRTYLVTWVQDATEVRAVLLDRRLEPITNEMSLGTGEIQEIASASDGKTFGVAWRTRTNAYFTPVDANGFPGALLEVGGEVSGIDVASDGDEYVVFAGDALVVPGGLVHPVDAGSGQTIAWDGEHFIAAWSADERVWFAEFDSLLNMTRAPERVTPYESVQLRPAIAGKLIAWEEAPLGDPYAIHTDIVASLIGGTRFLVSTSLADQRPLDAIWADGNLAMAWSEGDGAAESLRIGRMTPYGELLDGEGVALPAADEAKLAWNGSVYAVATVREQQFVDVAFFDSDLHPLGAPIRIGEGTSVCIASGDGDFELVYRRLAWGALATVHLTANGSLGEEHELPGLYSLSGYRVPRAIVWTGSEYAVVQAEFYGWYSNQWAIDVAHVTASGDLVSTNTIASGDTSPGGALPFATFDGHALVLVWNLMNRVYVQHGEHTPPELLATDAFAEYAGFDGNHLVLVLGHADAMRTLLRGGERIDFELTPSAVFAAGEHRVAIMQVRPVAPIPNLPDLAVQRATVRFVGGTKRRAV